MLQTTRSSTGNGTLVENNKNERVDKMTRNIARNGGSFGDAYQEHDDLN